MGEAKRRQEKDPTFGSHSTEAKIKSHQIRLSRSELMNLNGFLGLVLGKLATKAANLVGDIEASENKGIQEMPAYQELKAETEELLDYLDSIGN